MQIAVVEIINMWNKYYVGDWILINGIEFQYIMIYLIYIICIETFIVNDVFPALNEVDERKFYLNIE